MDVWTASCILLACLAFFLISENLFKGLSPWMDSLPGRLVHVDIFACTPFAAVRAPRQPPRPPSAR